MDTLLTLFFNLIILVIAASSTTGRCTNHEIRLVARGRRNYVQYCVSGEWRSLCTRWDNWRLSEAQVACRQLGYSDQGVTRGRECTGPETQTFHEVAQCSFNFRSNTLNQCGAGTSSSNCNCNRWPYYYYGWLQCMPACERGDIKLVGGSTNNQGRVEVCVDGHWGTVCNNNQQQQQQLAGAVCSRLGFPAEGTIISAPPGFVPVSSCRVEPGGSLSCSAVTDTSCDHSMDLGVVCRTYQQLYNELLENISSTNLPPTCPPSEDPIPVVCPTTKETTCPTVICPTTEETTCPTVTCPTTEETTCSTCDCLTVSESNECTTCPTATNGSTTEALVLAGQTQSPSATTANREVTGESEAAKNCLSVSALGGVVGVLLIVLVVLVIGWSLSCVALVKRHSNTHKQTQQKSQVNHEIYPERQLDNPVYDTNTEAHNYSSSGPTYELVDTNEGAGQTHAVRQHGPNEEHYYHVLEPGRCEGVTEGECEGVTVESDYDEISVSRHTHRQI